MLAAFFGRSNPGRVQLRFLRELRGQAASLVINGDLFDFWFEWRSVIPRTGFRVLAALADLADAGVDDAFGARGAQRVPGPALGGGAGHAIPEQGAKPSDQRAWQPDITDRRIGNVLIDGGLQPHCGEHRQGDQAHKGNADPGHPPGSAALVVEGEHLLADDVGRLPRGCGCGRPAAQW